MRTHSYRIPMAALLAAVATSAAAHELECEKAAGLVQVDAGGAPVVGENGLPVFLAAPASVLVVDAYPAAIGFTVSVHNVAPATSVVTDASDPLLEGVAGVLSHGAIEAGLSLPVGASATGAFVVTVQDQEQCLALLGEAAPAPVCVDVRENRFTVTHDGGSAECRARVICAPPQATSCGDGTCNGNETCATCIADCGACPPPPPGCGDGTCEGSETCGTCPTDCGICGTTTVSCTVGFTYGCSSDICTICDEITGAFDATGVIDVAAECWGDFTAGSCTVPAIPGYCHHVTPTTTAVMTVPVTADVREYFGLDWTPLDAAQLCAAGGGVWIP